MRLLSVLVLLVGCGPDLTTNQLTDDDGFEEEEDETPPSIVHDPITETQTFGQDVPISATVSDESTGVLFVHLFYKNEVDGASDWVDVIMFQSGEEYTGTIRGADMRGGGVDYYLSAVDKAQNTAFAPDDGDGDPFHFRIAE
jgi:hypothetical protein